MFRTPNASALLGALSVSVVEMRSPRSHAAAYPGLVATCRSTSIRYMLSRAPIAASTPEETRLHPAQRHKRIIETLVSTLACLNRRQSSSSYRHTGVAAQAIRRAQLTENEAVYAEDLDNKEAGQDEDRHSAQPAQGLRILSPVPQGTNKCVSKFAGRCAFKPAALAPPSTHVAPYSGHARTQLHVAANITTAL